MSTCNSLETSRKGGEKITKRIAAHRRIRNGGDIIHTMILFACKLYKLLCAAFPSHNELKKSRNNLKRYGSSSILRLELQ